MISKKSMLNSVKVLFGGILMLAGLSMLTACGSSAPDPKVLYEDKCSSCHGLGIVESSAYSSLESWQDLVDRMQEKSIHTAMPSKTIAEYRTRI